jgi:hypothetical protein
MQCETTYGIDNLVKTNSFINESAGVCVFKITELVVPLKRGGHAAAGLTV